MKRFLNQTTLVLAVLTFVITFVVLNCAPHLFLSFLYSAFLISLVLLCLKNICPKLARLILIFYLFILATQISSIMLTENYIDAIALTNLDEYTSIPFSTRLKIIEILIGFVICAFFIRLYPQHYTKKAYSSIVLIVSILFILPKNAPFPATSFINLAYNTTIQYYKHSKTDKSIREEQKKLYGKNYIVMNTDEELVTSVPNLQNKNIIVFFTEALSAQKIDLFNNYTDLTPNLSAFIKKSLYFDNYYNHTFSTYRGLRGQLSSSYQFTGIVKAQKLTNAAVTKKFSAELISLPQILSQNNYHTYFLSAQTYKSCNLNYMLNTLGFDQLFTPEEFAFNNDLTDQQLFAALKKLMTEKKLKEPYFLAIYNLGTHFGEDSPDLKYQDGNNSLLNNVHNFDNAFGKWFDAISQHPNIINNLAIILTADHAAYADKQYCTTFEYEPEYWIDKIALAIYSPQISPQTIDAQGRNSLDIAPTILHMLHINNAQNYFLGCSLFKPTCILPFNHYTVAGDMAYKTQDNHVYPKPQLDKWDEHILSLIENFYHLSEAFSEIPSKK